MRFIQKSYFGKKTPQAGGVPPRLEEKIDARSGVRVHADGTRNAAHFEVHKILAAFRPRSLLRSMFACVRPAKNMGRRVLTNFASNISSEKFHLEYSYAFLPESPSLIDAASRFLWELYTGLVIPPGIFHGWTHICFILSQRTEMLRSFFRLMIS